MCVLLMSISDGMLDASSNLTCQSIIGSRDCLRQICGSASLQNYHYNLCLITKK